MAIENPNIPNSNPLVDTSETTTEAYVKLRERQITTQTNPDNALTGSNKLLGVDDTKWYTSPNFKSQVYVYTPLDKEYHKYWTSMSIDMQIQDFMGTCELRAPYDSDLMAYWQPIAQFCIVYGSNSGPAKILFVGRVREVKQDGYECVVTLQNEGWKFQQDAPAKFVEDNVKNKDGLTIIKNIFEVLKITGYTISENAAKRLKEVGINDDGNLTLNGEEIEEMPDLIERLKSLDKADMTKIMGKSVVSEKAKEDELNWKDIYNINYTLQYSEPTATMTALNDSSNYSSGDTVYSTNYASTGTSTSSSSSSSSTSSNTYKSSKTKTGSDVWTQITYIIEQYISITKGKQYQYTTRLYKADAKEENIKKIVKGHKMKKSDVTQNIVIKALYYIKSPSYNITGASNKKIAARAISKAKLDVKASSNWDIGAAFKSLIGDY